MARNADLFPEHEDARRWRRTQRAMRLAEASALIAERKGRPRPARNRPGRPPATAIAAAVRGQRP